jgi:hypothetical protein
MKTVILGDTHGRSNWKLAIHQEEPFDRLIFIGDYFDSFHFNTTEQINNFLDIIEYKKTSGKEVILLIGNHDYHYFPEIGDTSTSGYQRVGKYQIEPIIEANREHLQMAYQFNDFFFTHAGVSSVWLDEVFGIGHWSVEFLADEINELFKFKPLSFGFNGFDSYGDDKTQTPIWIRPGSLMSANKTNLRKRIIQIVGHTQMKRLDLKGMSTGGRYYFIDTIETSGQYLIIEDDYITINSVK